MKPLSVRLPSSWAASYGCGLGVGWLYGVIGAVVAYVAGLVAQMTLAPTPNSRHLVLSIFVSMSRRHADYVRDGDTERAAAIAVVTRLDLSRQMPNASEPVPSPDTRRPRRRGRA